ncbi:MAG: hypothetical protein RMJ37_02535 [Spirochaetia bacterium]|nr:hypothetical protein [Spirochaetota bacterium]MCX8096086.1 hypothetical protein [Spirochaetota bacterium]MDW8112204.1 hypothetical protein [Spirochaetia bacterium]
MYSKIERIIDRDYYKSRSRRKKHGDALIVIIDVLVTKWKAMVVECLRGSAYSDERRMVL